MKLYINGPINIIKLEGSIKNIKKKIYIFMDIHLKENKKTSCVEVSKYNENIDVNKYFEKLINESEYEIDFFFEIQDRFLKNPEKYKFQNRYIDNIFKMFIKNFKKKTEHGIMESIKTKNTRIHYSDLRDKLLIQETMNIFIPMVKDINNKKIDSIDKLQDINEKLKITNSYIINIFNILYSKTKKTDVILNEKKREKIKKIHDKLRLKYKNKEISIIINKLLNNEIYEDFISIMKKYENLLNLLNNSIKNKFNDNIIRSLITNIQKIIHKYSKIMSRITDLYFIRRFLDKEYIKNGISYTGLSHSVMYIFVLIKYFNFKITDHSNIKEINEIYELSKATEKLPHYMNLSQIKSNKIYEKFITTTYNEKIYQCSIINEIKF